MCIRDRLLLTYGICSGQILCIQCFDQNDSIGVNVGANNLIVNGGFENTNCGFGYAIYHSFCPASQYYDCSIANWICTGGGVYTYADFFDSTVCYVEEGARSVYFGNGYANACNSNQPDTSCLINSGCIVTGIPVGYPYSDVTNGGVTGVSLSQTVPANASLFSSC